MCFFIRIIKRTVTRTSRFPSPMVMSSKFPCHQSTFPRRSTKRGFGNKLTTKKRENHRLKKKRRRVQEKCEPFNYNFAPVLPPPPLIDLHKIRLLYFRMKVIKRGKQKDAATDEEKARLSTMAEEEEDDNCGGLTIKVGHPSQAPPNKE